MILHRSNNFCPNWTITDRVMTLRWRPYRRKSSFAFWFYKVSHLGRQRIICIPTFHQISQSTAEILLFQVPKYGPILKFYFRFRFWPSHCHWHVILHWHTKFYANRMIADGVMTSYWFYKMAAIASEIYFRFLLWSRLKFRKVQSYRRTKFRPDISIPGRDITTSGFWKHTAVLLKFYSSFNFDLFIYMMPM